MNPLRSAGKCLVVSPHLDDAVLSCGQWIARHPGATVATVFAGLPAARGGLTPWDAASGFGSAGQAVLRRRGEDRAALAALSARPLWLDFCDSQYGRAPPLAELTAALDRLLLAEMPDIVGFPAGLGHADHVLAHQAMLGARAHHLDKRWLMYEDALYRRDPGLLQRRLAELLRAGVVATPCAAGRDGLMRHKRRAVRCYRSQLRALALTRAGHADAFAPERYWRLDAA